MGDVAAAVFEACGRSADDVAGSAPRYFADKPEAAPRPLNSVLDLSKITATGLQPRDWRIALAGYLGAAPPRGGSPASVNLGFGSLLPGAGGGRSRHDR